MYMLLVLFFFQLARQYDFLIIEDDPYYFLQFNKVSFQLGLLILFIPSVIEMKTKSVPTCILLCPFSLSLLHRVLDRTLVRHLELQNSRNTGGGGGGVIFGSHFRETL